MRDVFVIACLAGLSGCGPASPETVARAAEKPSAEMTVEPLEQEGANGGRIVFTLPGRPDDVLAMLLDFAHADGHRAWARRHELLSRKDGEVVARWHFHGKLGIEPTTEIVFHVRRTGAKRRVEFAERTHAFGIKRFRGEYLIEPVAGGSRVTARTFIDSGLFFADASKEDVAAGLREDARLLREWMQAR